MPKRKRPWVPCPRCNHAISEVLRVLTGGRRRRQCGGCGLRFLTSETTAIGRKVLPVSPDIANIVRSIPQLGAPSV